MHKPYNIGLDIGTNSIGWSVVDDQSKLIRIKGKLGYGVRLYDEGQTAEERRQFRTTRRRLKRRKWRLGLLREIFEPYLAPIDANFLMRQKQSNLHPKDPHNQHSEFQLFNDQRDVDFYKQYPTIYHLRAALMTEKRQFDLREIYLAMHHIVKYRGHFLNAAPASAFKSGEIDLMAQFSQLNQLFTELFNERGFTLSEDNLDELKAILLDSDLSASVRQRKALPLIYQSVTDKAVEKQFKALATELLKAILGLKAKLNVLTGIETDTSKAWVLSFNAEDFDAKLAELKLEGHETALQLIENLRQLYSGILLAGIVPEGQSISQAMIGKYDAHRQHLEMFRESRSIFTKPEQISLQQAYDDYIDNHATKEVFYAALSKVFKQYAQHAIVQKMITLIELEQFMPKQRTKDNGAIPHQLHQQELDQIIENQKAYYPWLAELNPNEQRQKAAPYKLDELVTFRVPYYVGPLVTAEDQLATSQKKFAWMVRKEAGAITPWNFDQKVDRQASANEFIKRMTTTDTYLLAEDVLPKQSLLYQRFEVLNELNGLKIDDRPITLDQKQAIFNDKFMQQAHVSVRNIQDYLVAAGQYATRPVITGLADEDKFNSNLTTYHDLKQILGAQVDDFDKQADLEKCIEWSTIFEDGQIFAEKLKTITWLTAEQQKQLANKRYRGWGRLSAKLLTQITDQNGQRVMDLLWNTNDNFMRIINLADFDQAIAKVNQALLADNNPQAIINDLYTSPQNKKALRQILLVVADIQKAMKNQAPARILIEFAREDQVNPRLSTQRRRQVEQLYQNVDQTLLSDPAIKQELQNTTNNLAKDRLFLYFMQGGRDIYTGKSLNIDRLSEYDIDHILPQSFIKDNSLDNRVLVSAKLNRTKADQVPLNDFTAVRFGHEMKIQWEKMLSAGLITRRKFNNLILNPEHISKYAMNGFINRQLVETRQVIKLATNLLVDQYANDDVQLITVKSGLTHQMREDFDFPKNRNLNNYHHAFDAYLTAFVGLYLLKKYPKLEPFFVYGQYQKGFKQNDQWRHFNFLSSLKNESVVNDATDEIIWQKKHDLDYMNKIYDFKKILVTREVHMNHGALYNQTLYKASDDKASGQGGRQLIAAKQDRPTALYGGYSGKTVAYLCLVRLTDKKGDSYRVCGVNTSWVDELEKITQQAARTQRLTELLTPQFTTFKKKKGESVAVIKPFSVVLPKVLINQRFYDGGQELTLASATYKNNAQELILNKHAVKVLNGKSSNVEAEAAALPIYDQILEQVQLYFPLYDMNSFKSKLVAGRAKFENMPWLDQWENHKLMQLGQKSVLDRILIGLHANAAVSDLKTISISTPFGKLQKSAGITLEKDSQIIYQSPTGLYERRVALKDL